MFLFKFNFQFCRISTHSLVVGRLVLYWKKNKKSSFLIELAKVKGRRKRCHLSESGSSLADHGDQQLRRPGSFKTCYNYSLKKFVEFFKAAILQGNFWKKVFSKIWNIGRITGFQPVVLAKTKFTTGFSMGTFKICFWTVKPAKCF